MSKPTLSVIIPVYNTSSYLKQCLQSLIMQKLTDIEVIMVNDGSTDGSGELLKRQAAADSRFYYIEQQNGGLSVARNTGLAKSHGTYVAFLDSDDWFSSENCLEDLCRIGDKTEADVITGNTWSVYLDNMLPWAENCRKEFVPGEVLNGGEFFVRMTQKGCYVPMVYNYLYRRDYLERNEFQFEPGLIHEDELWTPKVLSSAYRVVYADVFHYCYRHREGSIMMSASIEKRINSLQIVVERLLEYASGYINTETDAKVVKDAIKINVLRIYSTACSSWNKGMNITLYDKAGDVLSVCEELAEWSYIGGQYERYILKSMKDYFNFLQEL